MRRTVCLLALMFAALVVVGTTPASAACCVEDGSCQDQWTQHECESFGGIWYDGLCEANTCEQPSTGACCLEDGSCQELSAEECLHIGGAFFEGDCSTVTCEQPPTGACCLEDGSCQELSAEECLGIGGTFFEGDCSTVTCEQPPVEGCSPGFWKNHLELWVPDLCGAQGDCDYLIGELNATGPANGQRKNAAADIIDARWLEAYGEPLPCDESDSY